MHKIQRVGFLMLISVFVLFSVANASMSSVHVHNGWVREAPPSAKVLAGFLTLMNSGDKERILLSVNAEGFEKVEMHRTEMHGNMTHMVLQENIPVPPGGSVSLEPGGYHLMLMGPSNLLKAGDSVELKLFFDGGEVVSLKVPVKKVTGKGSAGNHEGHSGH